MALGWRQAAAGVRRALSPPVEAPADLSGWRSRVLCSVRLCAASDATRQEYLGRYIARGIALYDMLEDSIADEVSVLEGQPGRRAALFTDAEWGDLTHLNDLIAAAGKGGDQPADWERVREAAREALDRHGSRINLTVLVVVMAIAAGLIAAAAVLAP